MTNRSHLTSNSRVNAKRREGSNKKNPESKAEKSRSVTGAPSALKTSPVQGARQQHQIPSNFTAKLHRSLLEHKKKLKNDQSQDQLSVR